jgi:hypothetical protein
MGSAGMPACEVALVLIAIGRSTKIACICVDVVLCVDVMENIKKNQIEYKDYAFNFNPQASCRCIQIF